MPAGVVGLEMARHKDFTVVTDLEVYFCDPQSLWQRGMNENTNMLLRQSRTSGVPASQTSGFATNQELLLLCFQRSEWKSASLKIA
jgi:IS30 family transposase